MARRIESIEIKNASGLVLAGSSITSNTPVQINLPQRDGDLTTTNSIDTLTNKTLNDISNDIAANKLRSKSSTVTIGGNATAGHVLTALDASNAIWKPLDLPVTKFSSAEITTTDKTSTTIEAFTGVTNTVYSLVSHVVAIGREEAAVFTIKGAFRHNGTEMVRIGMRDDVVSFQDDKKLDVQTVMDGDTVQLQVIGKAGSTIKWKSSSELLRIS